MFAKRGTQNITTTSNSLRSRLFLGAPQKHSSPSRKDQTFACSNKRSGVTLVELIVGLALASIVIAAAGGIIIFGGNLFNHTAQRSQQQTDVTSVAGVISEELRYAASVEVIRNPSSLPNLSELTSEERILYIGDEAGNLASTGYLYVIQGGRDITPRNYYGVDFYGNYLVSLQYKVTVEQGKTKYFELSVTSHQLNSGVSTGLNSTKSFQLVNSPVGLKPFDSSSINSETTTFYILYTYPE